MTGRFHIQRRATRLGHVLTWCADWRTARAGLTDLLADAMHWCDRNTEDFHLCLVEAGRDYLNELNGEESGRCRETDGAAELYAVREALADTDEFFVPAEVIHWLDARIESRSPSPEQRVKLGLPPDPDGRNDSRAAWAGYALAAFVSQTGTDAGDAVTDLLCDLMHLADREGTDFAADLVRARMHYAAETQPDVTTEAPTTSPTPTKGLDA